MNKELKLLKNKLRLIFQQQQQYQAYCQVFAHRQMQFLLSQISWFFAKHIPLADLAKWEWVLSRQANEMQSWAQILEQMSQSWPLQWRQINWSALGHFLFYVYQHSLYDLKTTRHQSLYNQDNFVSLNDQKMVHYNEWIRSMYESQIFDFNDYVQAILKLVK